MDFNYWYANILKRELGSADPAKAVIEAEFRHCWSAAQSAPHSKVVIRAGITEEGMNICQGMRDRYMPWADIAKALGVNESTLRRAWKKTGRTRSEAPMLKIHEMYMARIPWKVIAREMDMSRCTAMERYKTWKQSKALDDK